MTKARPSERPVLSSSLAEFTQLPRKHLVELWLKHVGRPPPKAASTSFLLRAAAYSLQEQQYGGLKRHDLRLLHKAADAGKVMGDKTRRKIDDSAIPMPRTKDELGLLRSETSGPVQRDKLPAKAQSIALRPGTRLVREWQGRSHCVEVRADGFGWNSEVYRSLSAVAFAITGARWSGIRFFRL